MKTLFIIPLLLFVFACQLPYQFPRIKENEQRRLEESKSFCAKAPCTALVTHSTLDISYIDAARNNHVRYAKKYDLDYIFRNNLISDFEHGQFIDENASNKVLQLGLYWQKLIALNEALQKKDGANYYYSWVWWIDADAIFTNFDISPEQFIKKYGENSDLIIAKDPYSTVNAGVFALRNTAFSREFIQDIIDLYPSYRNEYLPEQIAMQDYILGYVFKNIEGKFLFTPQAQRNYKARPVPKVAIVSQRAMNSFYKGKLASLASGPEIIWEPGDFILHFAVAQNKDKSMKALLKCFEDKCGTVYENNSKCLEQCRWQP